MENFSIEKYSILIFEYGVPLFWAIIILTCGRILAKFISNNIAKLLAKSSIDVTIIRFVKNLTYTGLFIFVILAALEQLGIKTTSFTAVVAAAGLAIGFALQSSLSNFASGFLLLFFKPFKVGDYVDAAGVSGTIYEIQLFTTKLKTPDNKVVIVPNGQITNSSIVNYSAEETRRIDLIYGVSYEDNLSEVKKIIQSVLDNEPRILKDPEPTIGVLTLADSSVNFAVRPWVNKADYWPVLFHLNETMKVEFDKNGITIPFPQTDIHLKTDELPSKQGN